MSYNFYSNFSVILSEATKSSLYHDNLAINEKL